MRKSRNFVAARLKLFALRALPKVECVSFNLAIPELPHFNASKLENVVAKFYEAAVQTRLWPDALEVLAGATGAEGAILIDRRLDAGSYVCSSSFDEHMDAFVRENRFSRNYRFTRGLTVAHQNGVVTEGMLCTSTELDREPLQAEFLSRFGLRWFAGLGIINDPDADIVMSIDRKANSDPFSKSEVAIFAKVLPHIKRAGQLALASSSSVTSGVLRGLNQFGRAAILLDGAGKVVDVNEHAERLLGNGLIIVKGCLKATSRDADNIFQLVIGSAIAPRHGQISGPVALPRSLKRPLVAHIAPIVKSAREIFQRAKALVMFVDPEDKKTTPLSILQRVFGLTPAEARIAQSIAKGEDLRRAADANRIAYETARIHLKAVFAKTQTHRQVELAILINRLDV